MGARTASLGLEKVVKRQDCGRRAAVDEVEGNRGFGGIPPGSAPEPMDWNTKGRGDPSHKSSSTVRHPDSK